MENRAMTENEKAINILGHMKNLITVRIFEEEALDRAIKALEEVQQYRSIGTPEECRAAVEKQTAMKKYCDEEGCLNCPYHNPLLKENRCMNDFIVDMSDEV